MNTYAKVICDSVNESGVRLTTMELRYWRAIHSEIMTHRDRARNAASSRAIPFYREKDGIPVPNCTYSMVKNAAFMPKFIGAEQKGMQSGDELTDTERRDVLELIEDMKNYCLMRCKDLYNLGVHKSIINRYLEPWSYITVIMTATEWNNFFRLRIHPKAEKHFNELAEMMHDALTYSIPKLLYKDEWHLPYIQEEDRTLAATQALCYENFDQEELTLDTIIKRCSAARCARVSYLNHEGWKSLNDDLRLFNTLIFPKKDNGELDDTIHASPLEHVATPFDGDTGSPYKGWKPYRKYFKNESVQG